VPATEVERVVERAHSALTTGTAAPIADATVHVPDVAGLYAVYGDRSVWQDLRLGEPPDHRPLYVGKAENSLVSRDLRTHFETGRTGSSTLRRSIAALLHDQLDLHAQPRNTSKPERPANYGLPAKDDARLTAWMRSNLRLAVWTRQGAPSLKDIERAILERLLPPLNLSGVKTPWTETLKAARHVMADEARAWAQKRGHEI
jgi:hypothetical protein